ncbi:TnpV protein [Anaeromassilibacillus senegalensis]|uniref:TnpV protein n=1 Tax=Anaeromassilibacillus senegalensis TaxID=1673717 RepID=A0ABS9CP76_9FIRM|nr:TnpV protein [Anaeromassilibacillus senegalensis]MCF2652844.1 TnpV protein [Anaeromassilibacillus senegalensis]
MKNIFETFGGAYRQAGDYMVPDIKCPPNVNTGIWGQRRARYLRAEKKVLYFNMLTNGTFNDHLEEIDILAGEMFERLVFQLKREEGLTEQLKATDPLEWVRRMNSIRNRAKKIMYKELICV